MMFSRKTEGDSDVCGEKLRSVPDSISESLIALAEDTLFTEVMSENLLTAIKAIRKVRLGCCLLLVIHDIFDRILCLYIMNEE